MLKSLEKARFQIQNSPLGSFGLLTAQYARHRFARHAHSEFVIAIIAAGQEWFEIDARQFIASKSSVVFINPGTPHRGGVASDDSVDYRAFYIPVDVMSALYGADVLFTKTHTPNPDLATHLLNVHVRLAETGGECFPTLKATLSPFLGKVATMKNDDVNQIARLVREEIVTNYCDRLHIGDIAKKVGVSESYAHRVFRKQYGLTPHEFLIQTRLGESRALLQNGADVADVAAQAGFTDQSHLIRHFRAVYGTTPGNTFFK